MITQEQADYLLNLPKQIIEGEDVLEIKDYSPTFPVQDRIYMISKDDDEFNFFLEIQQSSKNQLKLTLHFQENETSIGLLRVDFNGRHKNPEEINSFLPELFKPFAGKWIEENHIHYFIQGYKPLAWAIPINIDESFSVTNFENYNNFDEILKAFMNKINLITNLIINIQIQIS